MPKPLYTLYQGLKANNYDVPDNYDSFERTLVQQGKAGADARHTLYNALKQQNYDVPDKYENFYTTLFEPISSTSSRAKGGSAPAPRKPAARPAAPSKPAGIPMSEADKERFINGAYNIVQQSNEGLQRTKNRLAYAKHNTGLDVKPVHLGQNRKVTPIKEADGSTHYITESGNEHATRATADLEQNAVDDYKRRELNPVETQLQDAYARRDELDNLLRERTAELDKERDSRPLWAKLLEEGGKAMHSGLDPNATANDPEHLGYENDEQYRQLMAAARKNHQAIQLLEDKKNGKMNNFWHGLAQTATNGYTFADGMPEMRDAIAIQDAQKHLASINRKRQAGEPLTKEEQAAEAVLENSVINDELQNQYGGDYGAWSRAGGMMANSIDFMKDFLLMPGGAGMAKGIYTKVASVGGKALAKSAGESALKAIPKAIARGTLKATGVLLGAHTAGAVISNTTGLGRTGAVIADQANGHVTVDQNGNFKMEDQKGLMSAIGEAERIQARENGSEMFGEFIPGGKYLGKLATKGLEKIGLSKVANFLTGMGNKQWYKEYSSFLKTGGYNGIPGEALEEYEGELFDALTGHADDAWKDFTDLKQNVDIWLGCGTMAALMGAIPMGMHMRGYYSSKHAMNNADKVASFRLTADKWQPLKDQIDNTDNGHMAEFITNNVLFNDDMHPVEKQAVLNYVRNLTKYRGFNIAQVSNAGDQSEEEQKANEAYSEGYNAPDEQKNDIKNQYEYNQERMRKQLGLGENDDIDAAIGDVQPTDYVRTMRDNGASEQDIQTALDYFNAKSAYEGMMDGVRDGMDSRIQESNNAVDGRTNSADGMIHPATLKAKDDKGNDKQAYIVSGNVVMTDDGTMVDREKSDNFIIIRNPETGELEHAAPEDFLSIDEPIDAQQEKDEAAEAIRQQYSQDEADKIDGVLHFNQGDQYTIQGEDGQQHSVQVIGPTIDPNTQQAVQGSVHVLYDGQETDMATDAIQNGYEANNVSRLAQDEQEKAVEQAQEQQQEEEQPEQPAQPQPHVYQLNDELLLQDENGQPVRGSVTAEPNEDGQIEVYTERPINGKKVNLFTPEELDDKLLQYNGPVPPPAVEEQPQTEAPTNQETEEQPSAPEAAAPAEQTEEAEEQPAPTALSRIPTTDVDDGKGNVRSVHQWEQATPEDTFDALTEVYQGDAERTKKKVSNRIKNIDAQLKKLQKQQDKLDESDDFDADIENEQTYKDLAQQQNALQAQKKYWQSVQGVPGKRQHAADVKTEEERKQAKAEHEAAEAAAAEQARQEREKVNGVPDMVNDTPANARARGFRSVNGHPVQRQEKIQGVQGREANVKFSNKDKVKGRVAVIEADQLQPSHISGQRNPAFFIDEAQPKNRTDAVSSMAAAKIAADMNPEEITGDGSAYQFSAPSVNARGEVIQGNNRSDALKLMWSSPAYTPAQQAYKQYLIDHAEEFGLDPKAIEQMKAPVMVNQLDVDDDEALRLGQKSAKDNESGGIERIDPVTTSRTLGSKVGSFANILLSSQDEEASISDLIAQNGNKAVMWLNQQGAINDTQVQSAFDNKGNLTPEARMDLQNILKQSLFEGAISDLPTMFDAMPAKAQKAILSTFMRDFDSTEENRILPEIQRAIEVWYEAAHTASDFATASNYEAAKRGMFGYTHQYQNVNGESVLPSENYSNFAIELACRMQGCTMRNVQQSFNDFFDFVQGKTQPDLFSGATMGEKLNVPDAIKRVFNVDFKPVQNGQERSNTMEPDTRKGDEGRPGEPADVGGGKQAEERTEPADSGRGTEKPTQPQVGTPSLNLNGEHLKVTDFNIGDRLVDDYDGTVYKYVSLSKSGIAKLVELDADGNETSHTTSWNAENNARFSHVPEQEQKPIGNTSSQEEIDAERGKVNTTPTDNQKEAGNYAKGHIKVDGYDITIENPKGSTRTGHDGNGKQWSVKMNYDYGYIKGTEGVDGDHIDVYLSDNPTNGKVYVVDQLNQKTGEFDEHKVMYGFPSLEAAKEAYASQYEKGWKIGPVSEVSREDFKKWVNSSKRKTKPFSEYKIAQDKAFIDSHIVIGTVPKAEKPKQEQKPVAEQPQANGRVERKVNAEQQSEGRMDRPQQESKPNYLVSDERMEEIRKKLRAKLNNLNMGIDPEVLMLGTELAVAHIERGAHKFVEYAKAMIQDLGDSVRPYLKAFYNGVRDMPEAADYAGDMTPYEEVRAFNVATIGNEGEEKQPSAMETAEQVSNEVTVEQNEQEEAKATEETSDVDTDTYSITKQHNNKKDIDIWVVRSKGERTDKDTFKEWKQKAKNHGSGYYSSFRGVNGFVFNTPEDARAFADEVFAEKPAEEAAPTTSEEQPTETAPQTPATDEEPGEVDVKALNACLQAGVPCSPRDFATNQPPTQHRINIGVASAIIGNRNWMQVRAILERSGYKFADDVWQALEKAHKAFHVDKVMSLPEIVKALDDATGMKEEKPQPVENMTREQLEKELDSVKAMIRDLLHNPNPHKSVMELQHRRNEINDRLDELEEEERKRNREEALANRKFEVGQTIVHDGKVWKVERAYEDAQGNNMVRIARDLYDKRNGHEYEDIPVVHIDNQLNAKVTENRGYKIGDKVVYTPYSSKRKQEIATIHEFEEYGDHRPVLDTGLSPIMYEVTDWENITPVITSEEAQKIAPEDVADLIIANMDKSPYPKSMALQLAKTNANNRPLFNDWVHKTFDGWLNGILDNAPDVYEKIRPIFDDDVQTQKSVRAVAKKLWEQAHEKTSVNEQNDNNNAEQPDPQQTAANTETVASQAETVAGAAETYDDANAARPNEKEYNEVIDKIDDELDKVNTQLGLLGSYKADEVESDFNEQYGYMKNAEKKAVADADKWAKKLAAALGIPLSKGKKRLSKANIAPAGGDITIRIPLAAGKELVIMLDMDTNFSGGRFSDDLTLREGVMYRIEDSMINSSARFISENNWIDTTDTFDEAVKRMSWLIKRYAPEFTPVEVKQPKEKKPTSKKSDTKTGTKAKPEVKQPSLFDLFDQQVTDEINKENEETEEKTENNQEKTPDNKENSVSSQSEEKPVTEVTNTDTIGDSEQYQQRKHEEDAFVHRIEDEIEHGPYTMDEPMRMSDVKRIVKDYPTLADLSDTDLQEMVELAMSNATRRVATDAIGKGKIQEWLAFEQIVNLYNVQPQLNARDSTRVELQQYSTPTPFAFLMGQFTSNDHEVKSAFDPTAGNGALTICYDPKICEVNEIDDRRLENLRHQNFGKVTSQDGLQPFAPKQVDAVLTNPPFGTAPMRSFDDGTYEITSLEGQIVINALDHMKDDGRAAIIIGGHNSYRSNGSLNPKDAQFLGYLYTHYNVVDVINVDGKLYGRNGTKYPVRMILIKGRRNAYKDGELQRIYPPVQKNARAEQVTTFDELYNRIQDDILSAKQLRLEPVDDVQGQSGLADNPRQPVQHSESDSGAGSRPVGGSNQSGPRHTPGTRTTGGNARTGVAATDTKPAGGAKPSTPAAERPVNGTTSPASSSSSVHRNESNGSSQPVGGRTDRPDSNAGRPASSRERLKPVALTAEKVHYPNQSQSMTLNSMVPANQAEAIADNLEKLGDVDQFLVDELGYSSKEELYSHLAAEQIDSVALAIHQMKQGKAFIIGDMTGIGKGRQGAALIRWAVKQGKTPIYLTQKPTLFSDNYRDLVDIGSGDLVPFIMGSKNQNSDPNITDAQGNVVHRILPDAAKKSAYEQIRDTGKLPEGYDFMITSYSQLQNGTKDFDVSENGEITQKDKKKGGAGAIAGQLRRDAFERLAQGNIIIMDESHTVGGSGNTGLFMQTVIPKAAGATFMSATFAKRADNMPIYALKTDLSESGIRQGELIDAVNKGGVTLQELMSKQLVESGQMIRRERDFTGVTIDWLSTSNDEATDKADQEKFDVCAEIFNDIRQFQDDYVTPVIEDMSEDAAETGGTVGHKQGTKDMGVNNAPFASKMFNLVNQLLLSMKVNAVVDRALVNLKKGEKPIITFSNTMEGFLEEAPQGVALDKVPSFSVTLKHALDGVMRWTKKNEKGDIVESGTIPQSQLPPEGQQKYKEIADKIRDMSVDLPISPMDAIKMRLQQAGYKVGEITGRKLELNAIEDGKYIIEPRKGRDKKAAARDFNSGDLDVLLINKSGSTGISLHASSKFKDQKPRVMIAAQFQSDINDEVQMRGRNDRTGQVHRGRYEYLVSSIPAEQRLQMMFKQKLKSLDANTTSSQKSKFNEMDIVDFLNKYGDRIAYDYMVEHPEIEERLGDPLGLLLDESKKNDNSRGRDDDSDSNPATDAASKVCRRLAFLPVADQRKVLNDISAAYQTKIDMLNESGQNDLVITTMPLRAKTVRKQIWQKGTNPNSGNAFADNTYLEQCEVDVLKKPMKAEEIRKMMSKMRDGKSWEDWKEQTLAAMRKHFDDYKAETKAKMEEDAKKKAQKAHDKYVKDTQKFREQGKNTYTDEEIEHMAQLAAKEKMDQENERIENRLKTIEGRFTDMKHAMFLEPGKVVIVPDMSSNTLGLEGTPAIFLGYSISKDFSISSSTRTFATLDGRRTVRLPLNDKEGYSRIVNATRQQDALAESVNLDNWDSKAPTQTRKKAYIVTGNLLKAIVDTQKNDKTHGRLIAFSDINGNTRQGILLPDKFEEQDLVVDQPISTQFEGLVRFDLPYVESSDGRVRIEYDNWRGFKISVPKSTKQGGEYFLDRQLRNIISGEFTTKGNKMVAWVENPSDLKRLFTRLTNMGVTVKGKAKLKDVKMTKVEEKPKDEGKTLFRTSDELFDEYPTWLSGQTTDTGQHTTQITSTKKTYEHIGDWMKKQGMDGAKVLDASSGLGAGTEALRDMGFDVDDVEPYPSENRKAPTFRRYEDIDRKYDVVISNAVLNVIPDDWRADVLKSMADKVNNGGKLIINVRDAKSIEGQKQKIELDSPSEILVTDKKGNIRAYQKGFTKQELKDWVQKELGDGWQVDIANESNSGVKSGTAVVVTRTADAVPLRYRDIVSFKDGQKLAIQPSFSVVVRGKTYNFPSMQAVQDMAVRNGYSVEDGQLHIDYVGTFPIKTEGYKVEGMTSDHPTKERLLDAFRNKYPQYHSVIEGDNIVVEPWSKLLGTIKRTPAEQRKRAAYAQRDAQRAINTVEELAKQMNMSGKVTVLTSTTGLRGRYKRAKGWYDVRTGKITIVLPNHSSVSDVISTLLHEGVGHYGLRQLFGEHFDDFLDNVYMNAEDSIMEEIYRAATRTIISGKLKRNIDEQWTEALHEATEEYLSRLAEDTDFERAMQQNWWGRIKQFFLRMLAKAGLYMNIRLSDNELRYILWRSYDNLVNPGERTLFKQAEDIDMQQRMGVGNFRKEEEPTSDAAESTNVGESRFRDDNDRPTTDDLDDVIRGLRDVYDRTIAKSGFQAQEAMQDSMLSLKKLMDIIQKHSSQRKVEDWEDAYTSENALSSRNKAEGDEYKRKYLNPMIEAVRDLIKKDRITEQDVADYVMIKHGLERNREMAVRAALTDPKTKQMDTARLQEWNQRKADVKNDPTLPTWRAKQEALDSIAENEFDTDLYGRDYSGLSAFFDSFDNMQDVTNAAYNDVEGFEIDHDTKPLEKAVHDATRATLDKLFTSGLIDRDTLNNIEQMYDYYVPLRGFDERTAEEVYAYLRNEKSGFTTPLKRAFGRSSKADNPFAYIASMADSAIVQGNRNLMKQKFLNFVLNRPSDLVSVSDMWITKNPATGEWETSFPSIPDDATADEVDAIVQQFNEDMQNIVDNEKDLDVADKTVMRIKGKPQVPYRLLHDELSEHQVIVKRGGREYVLTINGNPRAAMALNGKTNPHGDYSGVGGAFKRSAEYINRQLSAFYTTRNPDFVASNFVRDAIFSNSMVWVKEKPRYAVRYHRNFVKYNPVRMMQLFHKWNHGTLDMNDPTEKEFYRFMMNGGETGYSNMKELEELKKQLTKDLKNTKLHQMKALLDRLDLINRGVENAARFAAYMTSREEGRSVQKSVFDAKEISVNFNKKGAGGTFFGKTGQTKLGSMAAGTSAACRALYVFFNAGVQGTTNILRAAKEHKGKFMTMATAYFILGYIAPLLMGGDDGDDDKDNTSYDDLPDYVRRTNIIVKAPGKSYISLPLPVEFRTMYGMGELCSQVLRGKERYTGPQLAMAMGEQVTQALPINFLEGEGTGMLSPFIPSIAAPLYQAHENKDWTGMPIYHDNGYNQNMPDWTKAFGRTNRHLVDVTEWLNSATGGDKFEKGAIDLNPAIIESIVQGYFGGAVTFVNKMSNTVDMATGQMPFDWRNIPIGNRLVKSGDENTKKRAINREYFTYVDRMDVMNQRESGYKKEIMSPKNGAMEKAEWAAKLNDLHSSEAYKDMQQFEYLNKMIKKLGEMQQKAPDDKEIENAIWMLKAQANAVARGEWEDSDK
jgi:hypothetical protein